MRAQADPAYDAVPVGGEIVASCRRCYANSIRREIHWLRLIPSAVALSTA
jgi:hypothetical protein